MAVSKLNPVSTATSDNWVLISSVTPTATTSVNFTGISGYRKLMIIATSCGFASDAYPLIRLNNDSGGNYSHVAFAHFRETNVGQLMAFSTSSFSPMVNTAAQNGWAFQCVIDNTDTTGVKIANINAGFERSSGAGGNIYRTMNNTALYKASAAITQVNIVSSSPNFNASGTIELYGVRV
jgi:hypothetical protein